VRFSSSIVVYNPDGIPVNRKWVFMVAASEAVGLGAKIVEGEVAF